MKLHPPAGALVLGENEANAGVETKKEERQKDKEAEEAVAAFRERTSGDVIL